MDSNAKDDVVLEEMCVEKGTDSDDEEDSEEDFRLILFPRCQNSRWVEFFPSC